MSVFRIVWHFIELLVALYLTAGNKRNYAWWIVFLSVSKIILKYTNFPFLFLQCLNISKAHFWKLRENDAKVTFGKFLKSLRTCFPKETFPYFRQCRDTEVYFFTRTSGCSDDESSDDDRNRKESSQQCGECQEVASDIEAEKNDTEEEPTASQSPISKSARKRKVDAKKEIGTKRSKIEDRPGERNVERASPPRPGARRQTEDARQVNCPSSPGRRSLADSGDRPPSSLSGNVGQSSISATSAGMEQAMRCPEPDESTSSESMQLSPPAEESPPSAKISTSEESSRGEPMNVDTATKAAEPKALSTEKTDCDSLKSFSSCRNSILGENRQRAGEVPPARSRDSVESRASSLNADNQTMQQMPVSRDFVPRKGKHFTRCDKSTNTDSPNLVKSSAEIRRKREIAEATRDFFRNLEHKPKDPRLSGGKRTGGNTRLSRGRSRPIQYDYMNTHPLFRSRPRLDRPGPSSDLGCITTYCHKDDRGNMQYYREYPGLSLQPFSVKKDAIYQKRFYREKKNMFMPVKMGEMIQWAINLSQDLVRNIPRYSISDEEKLSLEDYYALSQQLVHAFSGAYSSARVGERKKLREKRKRRAERRKTSYATSSFQEESPSDSSSDETIHSLSLSSSEEDVAEPCVAPIGPSEGASHAMNLQLPHFSFGRNVARVLPQPQFLQASAPEVAGPSTSRHQHFQRNPEHRIRVHRYGAYSNPRCPVQPVEIKFVTETSRRSTRLIYCRDNMSSASDEDLRITLKPFFEVEVLQLEGRCPSVSVEEFLQTLFTFQELYYQMLYDESERFYMFREHMYRCVIPMRNIESDSDELDEDNPKQSTSGSGQSSKSLDSSGETSSTSETNITNQQQTQKNYQSGRQESLEDNVKLANKENIGQSEKSIPHPEISIPSRSIIGLPSSARTWERAVNRSESRGLRYPCDSNLARGATSKNEGKEFALGSAVGTSANEKRKHVVWYPPTAEEADKGTGLNSPPGNSETDSASE